METVAANLSDVPATQPRRPTVVASLLHDRRVATFLAIAGIAQLSTGWLHLRGLPCPLLQTTGIPCPGCGGTRACVLFLHGDINDSMHLHAFAPAFLLAIALFVIASLLPTPIRERFAALIDRIDRRTYLSKVALVALVLYWLARLIYPPHTFMSLVAY